MKAGALSKGLTIRVIRAIRSSSFFLTTNHTNHTNRFITTYSRIGPLGFVMSLSFHLLSCRNFVLFASMQFLSLPTWQSPYQLGGG